MPPHRIVVEMYAPGMRVALTVALVVAISAIGGCGGSRSTSAPSAPIGAIPVLHERFPHELHTGDRPEIRNWRGRGVACADCHDAAAVREGRLARPGCQ